MRDLTLHYFNPAWWRYLVFEAYEWYKSFICKKLLFVKKGLLEFLTFKFMLKKIGLRSELTVSGAEQTPLQVVQRAPRPEKIRVW